MSTLHADWPAQLAPHFTARPLASTAVVEVQLPGGDPTAARWRIDTSVTTTEDEPDVVILTTANDLAAVLDGSAPLAVAFMRGTTKVSGEPALALAVLEAATPR